MDYNEFDQKHPALAAWLADSNTNPTSNQEEIEEGDVITLIEVMDKPRSRNIPRKVKDAEGNEVEQENIATWAVIKTAGDRGDVSLATLQSTAKLEKHFGDWAKKNKVNLQDGKTLALPRTKKDALIEIETSHLGKKFKAATVAHTVNKRFGNEQTFVLWREV